MKTDFDGRRRRYVPLDVMVAFGKFGTKLIDKWGVEGIGTWALFLAACKREPVEGTFTYTTDDEAWGKLGARASGFTLNEFWTLTGQCKKTSRRHSGRITYVTCTVWNAWNTRPGAALNPRSEAQNTTTLRENAEKYGENTTPEVDLEVEVEDEVEKGLKNPRPVSKAEFAHATNGRFNGAIPDPIDFTVQAQLAQARKAAREEAPA